LFSFTKHYDDQIRDGMGGACDTQGRDRKSIQENLKERYHLEDLDIDGRIIIKWILK
jgi:hypothetical protein